MHGLAHGEVVIEYRFLSEVIAAVVGLEYVVGRSLVDEPIEASFVTVVIPVVVARDAFFASAFALAFCVSVNGSEVFAPCFPPIINALSSATANWFNALNPS